MKFMVVGRHANNAQPLLDTMDILEKEAGNRRVILMDAGKTFNNLLPELTQEDHPAIMVIMRL